MSKRRMTAMVVACAGLVVAVGLGSWYLDRDLQRMGAQVPEAAVAAAIDQYGHTMGLSHLQAHGATGWDDCAVVNVADSVSGKYYGSVLVTKEHGQWLLRASPETGLAVDSDDLAYSRQYCLDLAHASPGQG